MCVGFTFNLLEAALNHICYWLALLAAHHILHGSRVRVKDSFIVKFRFFSIPAVSWHIWS